MFKIKYMNDGNTYTVYKVQCPRAPLYYTYFLIFMKRNGSRLDHWEWVDANCCVPVEENKYGRA